MKLPRLNWLDRLALNRIIRLIVNIADDDTACATRIDGAAIGATLIARRIEALPLKECCKRTARKAVSDGLLVAYGEALSKAFAEIPEAEKREAFEAEVRLAMGMVARHANVGATVLVGNLDAPGDALSEPTAAAQPLKH